MNPTNRELRLLGRVLAFLVYLGALYATLVALTGRWVPTNGEEDLWLVSAIGFLAYALFDTPFFVPPSQVLASGVPSVLLLLSLDLRRVAQLRGPLEWFRWSALGLAVVTVIAACLAIAFRDLDSTEAPLRARIRQLSYRIGTRLGDGAVMFTPPALISIVGFHQDTLATILWLTLGWAVLVNLRPVELVLEVLRDMHTLRSQATDSARIGAVKRVDSPNIVRVSIAPGGSWDSDRLRIACLSDGRQVLVQPLFVQTQSGELVGTGLIHGSAAVPLAAAQPGGVYNAISAPDAESSLASLAGAPGCQLAGFVVEESRIRAIQFEVATEAELAAGRVVFCRQGGRRVYYQILDARTREENFEQNPRGTHIVSAAQLGFLVEGTGFQRYDWLPEMNAPVFLPPAAGADPVGGPNDAFPIGRLPRFDANVYARLKDLLGYHTAILGVTGTGKTELAFDLIRRAHSEGAKVFCVDFTGEYRGRLTDLDPVSLAFTAEKMAQLKSLVAAIETGEFGAAKEKKKLEEWDAAVRPEVTSTVAAFLDSAGPALGLFELPEIANTRATLRATELYLSAIFDWARSNRKRRSILVALEEAHTVIPEIGFFGAFDKGETQAVVGRISQIALQGRKYGVGLLLISQRTALVSKTLLSQCNTVVTFALHDKTSLEYLQGVFGQEEVQAIPRLPFRHAIAYGKGILSETPIIIEIPEDPAKKAASEALDAQDSVKAPPVTPAAESAP